MRQEPAASRYQEAAGSCRINPRRPL